MEIEIYQIDAFSDKLFAGNPAAVCSLEKWLSDELLQNIAAEINLPETAFFVKEEDRYHIRWFTPKVEVDLCGHATLAAAYVLFEKKDFTGDTIQFFSQRSGELNVKKEGEYFLLNFPSDLSEETELYDDLIEPFNFFPQKILKGRWDYVIVFDSESQIRSLIPDLKKIAQMDCRGVTVTAKGEDVDFVSRFFAPQIGINEDSVTGSAHTTLVPFWAKELGKSELSAQQLSKREGFLKCKYLGDRVEIGGQCKLFLEGTINVNPISIR